MLKGCISIAAALCFLQKCGGGGGTVVYSTETPCAERVM